MVLTGSCCSSHYSLIFYVNPKPPEATEEGIRSTVLPACTYLILITDPKPPEATEEGIRSTVLPACTYLILITDPHVSKQDHFT